MGVVWGCIKRRKLKNVNNKLIGVRLGKVKVYGNYYKEVRAFIWDSDCLCDK